ncbi:MAG: hypothetical protein AB3N11_07535 [Arenibacterium sp.]
MVCNPAPPKVTHVPDFFALAICPFCRAQQIVSHHDLVTAGRAIDGTAEWVCAKCKAHKAARLVR